MPACSVGTSTARKENMHKELSRGRLLRLVLHVNATPPRACFAIKERMDAPPQNGQAEAGVYGFVAWITSYFIYFLYLIWAFVPDSILNAIGLTYYPQKSCCFLFFFIMCIHPYRYWALAIPALIIVVLFTIVVGYASINMMNTPSLDALNVIADPAERLPTEHEREMLQRHPGSIPPAWDIPITVVNKAIYRSPPLLGPKASAGPSLLPAPSQEVGHSTFVPSRRSAAGPDILSFFSFGDHNSPSQAT